MEQKISEKLKELRKERGLTQKNLALLLDISPTGYAGYEQGYRAPDIETLIKLSHIFEVSVDYIIGTTDDFGNITVNANTLRREEENIIRIYRTLPAELQRRVEAYVQKIGDVCADERAQATKKA